ncbi:hypothetical protein DL240_02650 [Lujinxingia litoralis]|uniref:DUF302 domain-containing protein n=1 Tax=Lujinxingia litoralis TaxID=2211119 RepID=A0A328CBZ0_9DELT|nr:DUF302 domain-containing protein [Lujinxingia litoralis]RAL25130.1 hypothetical protein DL240_02650 [Lujinxingia litoralis]
MYDRDYALTTRVEGTLQDVDARVREALKAQGFGVLTEIDIQATLKKKLDVDRRPYVILGACSPPLAHKALEAELPIGLLLPCNVTIFEGDDAQIYVQAINPVVMFEMIDNPQVAEVAQEVGERLQRALDAL